MPFGSNLESAICSCTSFIDVPICIFLFADKLKLCLFVDCCAGLCRCYTYAGLSHLLVYSLFGTQRHSSGIKQTFCG
jgi:hypothetical protein